MKKHIIQTHLLCLMAVLMSCSGQGTDNKETASETCCCPPTITLQPLGNFSKAEAEQLRAPFEAFLQRNANYDAPIEINDPMPLQDEWKNDAGTRYRADKIIKNGLKMATKDNFVIGILHPDISCTYKGRDDWGVQGLTLHGAHACVVSSFRVKNTQRDLWKVVAHEFVHSFFHYSHCPKDSVNCIIQDAKGRPRFADKQDLCGYCKAHVWDTYGK